MHIAFLQPQTSTRVHDDVCQLHASEESSPLRRVRIGQKENFRHRKIVITSSYPAKIFLQDQKRRNKERASALRSLLTASSALSIEISSYAACSSLCAFFLFSSIQNGRLWTCEHQHGSGGAVGQGPLPHKGLPPHPPAKRTHMQAVCQPHRKCVFLTLLFNEYAGYWMMDVFLVNLVCW